VGGLKKRGIVERYSTRENIVDSLLHRLDFDDALSSIHNETV
jgi:hypothetical protein